MLRPPTNFEAHVLMAFQKSLWAPMDLNKRYSPRAAPANEFEARVSMAFQESLWTPVDLNERYSSRAAPANEFDARVSMAFQRSLWTPRRRNTAFHITLHFTYRDWHCKTSSVQKALRTPSMSGSYRLSRHTFCLFRLRSPPKTRDV